MGLSYGRSPHPSVSGLLITACIKQPGSEKGFVTLGVSELEKQNVSELMY